MIVKDWRAKALLATASYLGALADASAATERAEEAARSLELLGISPRHGSFAALRDDVCRQCDAPGCEEITVDDAWAARDAGGKWLCGKHQNGEVAP